MFCSVVSPELRTSTEAVSVAGRPSRSPPGRARRRMASIVGADELGAVALVVAGVAVRAGVCRRSRSRPSRRRRRRLTKRRWDRGSRDCRGGTGYRGRRRRPGRSDRRGPARSGPWPARRGCRSQTAPSSACKGTSEPSSPRRRMSPLSAPEMPSSASWRSSKDSSIWFWAPATSPGALSLRARSSSPWEVAEVAGDLGLEGELGSGSVGRGGVQPLEEVVAELLGLDRDGAQVRSRSSGRRGPCGR